MEQKKEVTLEELCSFAQMTPEQLVNKLIAAGKVNRGHYKAFMKFEADEIEAMRHRIRYNEATINLFETDLKIKSITSPGFPKTIDEIVKLQQIIDKNNKNWEEALEGAKTEVDALNKENTELKEQLIVLTEQIRSLSRKKLLHKLFKS